MKLLKITALLSALTIPTIAAEAADLNVTVEGLTETAGKVMVGLYDGAEGLPSTRDAVTGANVDAKTGSVTFSLTDLAAGKYALAGFHDVNGNGKLDTNLLGMPTEPFGFSRNARGSFGPPAFEDAAVELGAENLSITFQFVQ